MPPQWSIGQLLCVHVHCVNVHTFMCAHALGMACAEDWRPLVALANRAKPLAFWRREKLPS